MKKALVLALAALLVIGSAVAVYGKAAKVPLEQMAAISGEGFVIFNNPKGQHNLNVTIHLKGAAAATDYDVYITVDGDNTFPVPDASFQTDEYGDANCHINTTNGSGTHWLSLIITLSGDGADQFRTVDTPESAQMALK